MECDRRREAERGGISRRLSLESRPLNDNNVQPALGEEWMIAERMTFTTKRLTLRPPVLADADAVFHNYAQDPEVTRFLVWRPHVDVAETESFLESCLERWNSGEELTWVITLHGSDEAIGMVAVRPDGHIAEIGYVLARSYWDQGLMTESVRRVKEWLCGSPEIYRVWATCDVENLSSARVLEKVGMQREGVLRRWMVRPNISAEPRDCLVYAWVR